MKRMMTHLLLCALLTSFYSQAQAQQTGNKVPLVGIFLPESAAVYATYNEAFEQGLRALGYAVDPDISLEYRYTEGKRDRLSTVARELVRLKVDVLVVVGRTLDAAKQATNTVPIVGAAAGDLVGAGYVASLARPGGNITGSTNLDSDLSMKRLELLKETFPRINRVAFLSHDGNKGGSG